jgi:DNA polymerase I-like protein with 3'-5' exonuclease and polymerase domains
MIVAFDVETTTHNKGNPYDSRNSLVCWSYYTSSDDGRAVHHSEPGSNGLVSQLFDGASLILGFNLKFDLHWARKLGITYNPKKIWDVQIAEFILSNQTQRFPSLEETAQKYGLGGKEDVVKTQYWDKGIDTADIPWEILSSYAALDTKLTYQCYVEQLKRMTPKQIRLCQLQCQDLAILQEMEENGLPFDEELCRQKSIETEKRIEEIKLELEKYLVFTSIQVA